MLIDTHTHVNLEAFNEDADFVIKRSQEKNIWLVNIGTNYKSSQDAIDLAEKYEEGVYASVGVHPDELTSGDFDEKQLRDFISTSTKVVAIGEVGLDIYRTKPEEIEEVLKVQEASFRRFIRLANELNLAVIIHARGTAQDPTGIYDRIIQILEEERPLRAVSHCFGGTLEQGAKLAQMGYMIGITGIVTFKNAKSVADCARWLPLQNLVIETDAPYLAPEPYRGQRNEPAYVEYVAKKIAEIRGIEYNKVAEETTINARRLYVI